MKFSEFFTSKDNIQLDKKTLVTLRWIALVGQYLTISIVYFIFRFELPFFYCSLVICIGVVSNIYLQFKFKKNQLNNFASTFVLFYDLIQLSLLLYLTGGITNPFSILLIVPAIVASTFLNIRSAINLSITTIIILIALTIYNLPLPHYGELHFHIPDPYLYALPASIMITLIFLTYFGVRFGMESRKRTEALNKLELILAKEHELESIGLQAAAAAHSLGTPLSTITVVARELEKEIGKNPKYAKDIDLLLSQTKRCSKILRNLSKDQLQEDNFLSNDGIGFKYNKRPKDIYFSFKKLLEGHRFDSIAAGLQLYTEKIVYQWMRNAMLKYSINRVVFSGGVSMNIKLNKHIASMPEIEDFYVSPSGGDESLAIGSYYKYTKEKEIKPLSSIYLGPKYSSVEVIHAIQSYNNKYRVDESVTYSDVASLIAEGNIVARFDGRMEFGARALGNRSILGDPSKIETMKRIN